MQHFDIALTHIFVPSKIPSKKIMIILHGRGDSSQGFTWLPPYLNMDDMNYLLLDAPHEYSAGYSWYDMPPHQLVGISSSSQILTQILDILFIENNYIAKESFLFGFSQGSLLTFEFGARYHKVLAGYMAISGYIYDTSTLLTQMNPELKNNNWLCTHGTEDAVLPYLASKEQVKTLIDGGFNITFKSYTKAHTICEEELLFIKKFMQECSRL